MAHTDGGELRVVVAGATGKTGSAVTRALLGTQDLRVVAAVAKDHVGEDLGSVLGVGPLGVTVAGRLAEALEHVPADVLVDFTAPDVVVHHIETALARRMACVIGTTGIPAGELERLGRLAAENELALLVIANFSLGAMLLKRLAREAARYFPAIEIIEKHHVTKVDAPSGTALRLAEAISAVTGGERPPIHSVRLPGFVAHHEILLGGAG
ncbi:MAG TPA: 4-hydroxy-tetrahydrodipicolinate reductase, partial [Bacillota bacterium]